MRRPQEESIDSILFYYCSTIFFYTIFVGWLLASILSSFFSRLVAPNKREEESACNRYWATTSNNNGNNDNNNDEQQKKNSKKKSLEELLEQILMAPNHEAHKKAKDELRSTFDDFDNQEEEYLDYWKSKGIPSILERMFVLERSESCNYLPREKNALVIERNARMVLYGHNDTTFGCILDALETCVNDVVSNHRYVENRDKINFFLKLLLEETDIEIYMAEICMFRMADDDAQGERRFLQVLHNIMKMSFTTTEIRDSYYKKRGPMRCDDDYYSDYDDDYGYDYDVDEIIIQELVMKILLEHNQNFIITEAMMNNDELWSTIISLMEKYQQYYFYSTRHTSFLENGLKNVIELIKYDDDNRMMDLLTQNDHHVLKSILKILHDDGTSLPSSLLSTIYHILTDCLNFPLALYAAAMDCNLSTIFFLLCRDPTQIKKTSDTTTTSSTTTKSISIATNNTATKTEEKYRDAGIVKRQRVHT